MTDYLYIFCWGNNPVRAKYKGKRCRILADDRKKNTMLVEFEDGHKMTTSRQAVRKANGLRKAK